MERMICSVKVWESGCCEDVEMGGDRGVIVVLKSALALRSGYCCVSTFGLAYQYPVVASRQPTIMSMEVALAFEGLSGRIDT
jgi:hypothetical protein